ncbi:MAG: hypothetical protein IPM77_18420 [Crocinitomicaceae bacterium]|nr:hypothetical protein [Crocinitomicaceae bacterium]
MSSKIKLSALVVFIISLGFIRDYFFVNINWILMTITNGRRNQALDEFHFLLNWTPDEINNLKWVLTFVFSGLFMAVTYLIVRISFQNKLFNRITVYSYLGILFFAFGLYFLSFLVGMTDNLYGIIRTIMGIAQSFMPLMILYILFKFLPDSKKDNLA